MLHAQSNRTGSAVRWATIIAVTLFAVGAMFYYGNAKSSSDKTARSDRAAGRFDAARDIVIIVSGDTAGWLVPCGCASNQSGGLLRRGTFVAEEAKSHDVLVVDAG